MEFLSFSNPTTLVALPILGCLILLFVPGQRPDLVRWISIIFATVVLGISIYFFIFFDHSEGGKQFVYEYEWLSLAGPWVDSQRAISMSVGIDGIAATMVLLTGIVMFTGTLVSWNINVNNKDFFILYFLLLSGVFGVFIAYDLFFFFFFYELSVLPMYLLIAKWGSSSKFSSFERTKEYSACLLYTSPSPRD